MFLLQIFRMFHFVLRKWFVLAIPPEFSSLIENSCDIFAEVGCLWFPLSGFSFFFFFFNHILFYLFLLFYFKLSQK